MRNLRTACAACALLATSPTHANYYTSHTFFSARQQFRDVMPEKISLFEDRMLARPEGILGAIQIVPFYSKSINSAELARFFMPFGKTQIIAGEFNSQAVQDNSVDVMANYFGVLTRPVNQVFTTSGLDIEDLTFQSTVQFKPVQTVFGIGLSYQQQVTGDLTKGTFINISAPITRVHNDLGLCETVINPGGGDLGPAVPEGWAKNMTEALSGHTIFGDKRFKYGKVAPCGLSKWGLADIEVWFGYENRECSTCHRAWWVGIYIPTGNRPEGKYLFEPIVGNDKHFGVMFGGIYKHLIWTNNDDKELWMNFHSQTRYLFTNKQRRAMDLIDKQWSRYLWMFTNKDHAKVPENLQPGINFLTLDVNVSPRSALNLNSAIVYSTHGGFIAEAGLNSYARQSERVALECPFSETIGIAGMFQDRNFETTTQQPTKSNATIRRFLCQQRILNDVETPASTPPCCDTDAEPLFIPITEGDLDPTSAAHPATISFSFYGTLGYSWNNIEFPTFVTAGGSYEFSADNAGLERWLVWAKFGMSF
jgi:hypothetical protein